MKEQTAKWFISRIFILPAMLFVVWLVMLNFPLSGEMVVSLDINQDQNIISSLGPKVRVNTESNFAIVLENPVYFDARIMPWFDTVEVAIVYDKASSPLKAIGGQTGPGFSYALNYELLTQELDETKVRAVAIFKRSEIYTKGNISRFLIESETAGDNGLKIYSVTLILKT